MNACFFDGHVSNAPLRKDALHKILINNNTDANAQYYPDPNTPN